MKIELKTIDEKNKIIQVTTSDERWYRYEHEDSTEQYLPSVTWICGYYPKDKFFMDWYASNGKEQAENIRDTAANRGSKVHAGCEAILNGETVKHDAKFKNSKGDWEEITAEEYEAIISFANWINELKEEKETVEIVSVESNVFNFTQNYAGTVDIVLKVDGEYWIIDIKTSKSIYPSHELQLSAYKHALPYKDAQIFVLQVGYARNKKRYKLTQIKDQYEVFKATQTVWKKEVGNQKPYQRDYPLEVKMN